MSHNFSTFLEDFDDEGAAILPEIISAGVCKELLTHIKKQIREYAHTLNVPLSSYLSVIGRWQNPSLITESVEDKIYGVVAPTLKKLFGKEPLLKKTNIICKNQYFSGEIPFHQDISYSPKDPYAVTVWLALNNVTKDNSPLEIIPGSHHGEVKPAVDFWAVDFKDDVRKVACEKNSVKILTLRQGDAIVFDSRLYHGSSESRIKRDRFAIVTRWSFDDYVPPSFPLPEPSYFGMWTCNKVTCKILRAGLSFFGFSLPEDFLDLLLLWRHLLASQKVVLPNGNERALTHLTHLCILHLAATHHNGGDAQGVVYKNIWHSFLAPLQTLIGLKND